jgi:hypothetical protein
MKRDFLCFWKPRRVVLNFETYTCCDISSKIFISTVALSRQLNQQLSSSSGHKTKSLVQLSCSVCCAPLVQSIKNNRHDHLGNWFRFFLAKSDSEADGFV